MPNESVTNNNFAFLEKKNHPFHIVDPSPLPILTSFALLLLAIGGIMFMHSYKFGEYTFMAGIVSVVVCMYVWWKEVIQEGLVGKFHTQKVRAGLRIGMALFILSEIAFFAVFFATAKLFSIPFDLSISSFFFEKLILFCKF
jgi:cytochrome c oxidase subunit 3